LLASIITDQNCQVRAVALQSSLKEESASLTLEENPMSGLSTSTSGLSELSGLANNVSTADDSSDMGALSDSGAPSAPASPFQFDLNQIV